MNQTTAITCHHKFCGEPVSRHYACYKFSAEHAAMVPFHTACANAHPDYDVSQGLGSPFTSITVAAV